MLFVTWIQIAIRHFDGTGAARLLIPSMSSQNSVNDGTASDRRPTAPRQDGQRAQTATQSSGMYVSPRLRRKRKDLAFDAALSDAPEPDWAADIDQIVLFRSSYLTEVVFFHRPQPDCPYSPF